LDFWGPVNPQYAGLASDSDESMDFNGSNFLQNLAIFDNGGALMIDRIPAQDTVLVTVPVHNEAKLLRSSIETLESGLARSGLSYTLAIVEDGSTDNTTQIISSLESEFPKLIVRSNRERLGRGLALRRLWSELDSDIYVFVDADLASGPTSVEEVVRAVRSGADVATGSRYCPESVVHRPPLRRMVSMAYNRLVQFVFRESIRDHQCGLKAFNRHALSTLLPLSRENTWAWDTEALVLATYCGLKVVEVPIEWTEFRSSRTPLGRLTSDVFLHGESVAHLWDRTRRSGLRAPPAYGGQTTPVARKRMGARGTIREPLR
jgi:glycosyltransferase AglD